MWAVLFNGIRSNIHLPSSVKKWSSVPAWVSQPWEIGFESRTSRMVRRVTGEGDGFFEVPLSILKGISSPLQFYHMQCNQQYPRLTFVCFTKFDLLYSSKQSEGWRVRISLKTCPVMARGGHLDLEEGGQESTSVSTAATLVWIPGLMLARFLRTTVIGLPIPYYSIASLHIDTGTSDQSCSLSRSADRAVIRVCAFLKNVSRQMPFIIHDLRVICQNCWSPWKLQCYVLLLALLLWCHRNASQL